MNGQSENVFKSINKDSEVIIAYKCLVWAAFMSPSYASGTSIYIVKCERQS